MKTPRRDTRGTVGFDMTPMIDIVFQLIIFFLLTGHLVKQETQLELLLPQAASGEVELDSDAPRVTVNVQADGQVSLGAGIVSNSELIERLIKKRDAVNGELEVRIRSDRHVPYRVVEPIMRACANVGIWKVTFAVFRPGDEVP